MMEAGAAPPAKGAELLPSGPLSHGERVKLLEAAMESKDQDNEALMNKIRHRMDNVGLKFPAVEVRYEDLQVEASVYLGTRALPTLSNFAWNALASALTALRLIPDARKQLPILHGVSGVLKPGRLTLLLGPPGAGKSTLMKALSGRTDAGLRVSGDVTYNGHGLKEFEPVRTAAYVAQSDKHIAEMTVRETLEFSAQVQGRGFRTQQASALSVLERDSGIDADPEVVRFMDALAAEEGGGGVVTEYVLKILGLDVCAETILGDAFKRGVSGGQKKRVTTGEMIVGPRQVLFMDEISTGLDSSTTYLITRCLRHFTHASDATVLVALLQPAPETYELFDDVMLLSEGHVVYHGPREECPGFFQQMGFRCPERKGEPDFLQEVTSLKDQQNYWVGAAPYAYIPMQKFAREFHSSVQGRLMAHRLQRPYPPHKSHPQALARSKYALPQRAMLAGVLRREWMLWRRNWFLVFAQLLQMVVMGLIGGTVFFRTRLGVNIQDGTYYLGALFFGIMSMLFNGFSDLTLLVTRLPVFYKQRDENMYPAWAWGLPIILLSLPVSLAAGGIYTGIAYFLMGLTADAGRFLMQMLLFALVHQMALALFRLAGAVGRSMVVALTFGSFLLVVLFVLGGYILPHNLIPGLWLWGFWASPISYAQNALSINELLAPRWQVPAGPIAPGSSVGLVVLATRDLFHERYWRWIGVASQLGYFVLFNALTIAALAYLRPWGQPQPVLSEEQLQEKVAARTGDMDTMSIAHERADQRRSSASSLDQFRSAPQSFTASDGTVSFASKSLASKPCPDIEALGESGERHGMILPFTPLSLSFHNVNYYVDMPAEMKGDRAAGDRLHLLKNVSGAFRPKVLTALMGVSGAGKTTLMDVLAGRKTGGYIEGDIRVSGYPKVQQTFARVAGYCEQTDVHTPQVTVRESLAYSAWLRLPREADRQLREDYVDEVMELVELEALGDALVGMPGVDGLSTEQRKRLTIAVELVANPSIIFMDEPTSGLDARAAAIVMRAVRNTVDTGRTVVCTIHQPSIDIFEAFDELLLMKRGGEVIYLGPLGANSRLLVSYFGSIPGVPPIPDGYNPAAWMLDVSGPAAADSIGADFAEIYRNSALFKRNEVLIEELRTPPPGHQDLHFPTVYSRGFLAQLQACLWKRNRMYWRAPSYNVVRMFFATVMGLLMGGVFFGLGAKRSTSVEVLTIMGAMYTASLFMGFNNQATVQPLLSVERSVFYRERAAGLYGAYPYALAQGLVEIPYVLTQTLIYSLLTYSMFKLEWHGGKFMWYTAFMFLTLLYFTYYGMMAVAITPNEELATVVSSLFFGLWNVLCGFLLPGPAIPAWWKWFYWINPVTWTLYGLVTSQLADVSTPINEPGKPPGSDTVQQFLQSYFGFYHSNLGYNLLILATFAIGFFAIFAIALKRLNFQNR